MTQKRPYIASGDFIERVAAGQTFAVARMISRAEAGVPEARKAMGAIFRRTGRARIVGITGVPGSGKSTLVSKLVEKLRAKDLTVAVIAIDPSSPYSGGAILGDRIRMSDLIKDKGVFIRSMATRGATGGMAHAALDVADILDVAGFDVILIETVGVGQDEVEIANASHTTVVVSAPGLGDEVQAIKAGILEIADIHVVSKSDRSDANRTVTDLKMMLKDARPRDGGWRPPVVALSSVADQGFEDLMEAMDGHGAFLAGPEGADRRQAIARFRLRKTGETILMERFRARIEPMIPELAERLVAHDTDPYSAARRLAETFEGAAADDQDDR